MCETDSNKHLTCYAAGKLVDPMAALVAGASWTKTPTQGRRRFQYRFLGPVGQGRAAVNVIGKLAEGDIAHKASGEGDMEEKHPTCAQR